MSVRIQGVESRILEYVPQDGSVELVAVPPGLLIAGLRTADGHPVWTRSVTGKTRDWAIFGSLSVPDNCVAYLTRVRIPKYHNDAEFHRWATQLCMAPLTSVLRALHQALGYRHRHAQLTQDYGKLKSLLDRSDDAFTHLRGTTEQQIESLQASAKESASSIQDLQEVCERQKKE